MMLHKARKERSIRRCASFLDMIRNQELSPSLIHGETHTFHLHLAGLRREKEHNFSAAIPRPHPLFIVPRIT